MNVAELRREVAELAERLDPAVLSVADAKKALGDMTAVRNIANLIVGKLGRRVAEAHEWEREGYASEEQWLAAVTGSSAGAAKDALATARRLEELDAVADAADRGELSPEQVTAIADACDADPSAQQRLVATAKSQSLSRLRQECARTKANADPDPEATWRRHHAARHLRFHTALDGAAQLMGASTPEEIAVIKAAVEKRADHLFNDARRQGRRDPHEAYLLDALVHICRDWLDGRLPGAGDSTEDQAKAKPKAGRARWLGMLRIDLQALLRGHTEGGELCEIPGAGPMPVTVARQLLGDSLLKLVITNGVDVRNITHLGRGALVAQKIALLWQSPGCCVADCNRTAGIQIDHRTDWAKTRRTILDELQRLCDHHHELKTYEGWVYIRCEDGTIRGVPPDDPRHPKHADARAVTRAGPDPPPAAGDNTGEPPDDDPTLFDSDAA